MKEELLTAIESDKEIREVWSRLILAGYAGSIAHGTVADDTDDVDIMGVYVGDRRHYLGLKQTEHVCKVGVAGKYDFALYEIRKYFRLLLKSNPNVLALLWLPDNLYIWRETRFGHALIANRHLFLSKAVYKSFIGYAFGQMKKMSRPCTDQAFQGAKRRERFKQFGYDCKNAAHMIRLLRMGVELLSTGELNVQRKDAAELKEIKSGKWKREQVISEGHRLTTLMDESLVRSNLIEQPAREQAEQLLIKIVSENL